MTIKPKCWVERSGRPEAVRQLMADLDVFPLTACSLANRGIHQLSAAREFLQARLNSLPDPDLLPDMEVAVQRLVEALGKGEKIAVHGDYDVDGITGTALLVESLRAFGANVEYHIPSRMKDGYGLSAAAINCAAQSGCTLVLSVDCGVSALVEADLIARLGLDLIVTDHHQPPEKLPNCLALVNPHLRANRFPCPDLAGVGVAFFLLLSLRRRLRENGWFTERKEPDLRKGLDLVALGTIADMVPLSGVNRILVRFGLQLLDAGERPGVAALKVVADVTRVTCGSVGFRLAPRLNAAGRLEEASLGAQLLLGEGSDSLAAQAAHLDCCNRERQQIEEQTLQEAIAQIESGCIAEHSLVLAAEGWHPGVIGIVASRLVERYYRPTVMIALADGLGKGSARSVHGFHLFAALGRTAQNLLSFGGHAAAAGLSLESGRVEAFRNDFEKVAAEELTAEDLVPRIEHDGEVGLGDLSLAAVAQLAELAPFGMGNPQPTFVCSGLIPSPPQIVGGKHLRFNVSAQGAQLNCIAFGMANRLEQFQGTIDLLFRPEINSFRGRDSVQLQVVDLRSSGLRRGSIAL
ncbi:single-stranded-DNA-specific exonuclease RecJ [Geopsychrobacter electrodiphilus]|uniref:single-stranded-DNA-specific exonuclease RecJ n=1 Tax=Geopsychrobacter electrodiphilus TaxID=225196 RepID=UPI000374FA79|nr:single-stranded-DNA-specific exonuclease RecJ [Geopsychrobacter electrodiphilus]